MKVQNFEICEPPSDKAKLFTCTPPRCLVECGLDVCANIVQGQVCI